MASATVSRVIAVLMLGCLLITPLGCDPQTGGSADDTSSTNDDDALRIVSLTPAITQMLIDMGKRDQLVGVSKDDDASLGLPVCGGFNTPDTARIVTLEPDIVLTESPGGQLEDADEGLRDHAKAGVYELKVIPHCRSIADVYRALIDPEVGLGVAVGDQPAAERARDLMELRIDLINAVVQDEKRPRVLMLINPKNLGAIGTGVTHDELLRMAGGTNALDHINTGYLTLDRAQLQETIRPDMVLILEPGGSELQDGDVRLRAMEGLTIPAVMNRRFAVIKHPQAMLPSTALPEVMLEMAMVLHPDKTASIQAAYDTAEAVAKQSTPDGDGS